jgi:hypothetical protein
MASPERLLDLALPLVVEDAGEFDVHHGASLPAKPAEIRHELRGPFVAFTPSDRSPVEADCASLLATERSLGVISQARRGRLGGGIDHRG